MKKPELILHIGYPKTGSTALQMSFIKNNETLISKGIYHGDYYFIHNTNFYLELVRDAMQNYFKTNYTIPSMFSYQGKETIEFLVDRIKNGFFNNKCERLLITSEAMPAILENDYSMFTENVISVEKLENAPLYFMGKIKELFSDFDIKVVIYIRRQDLYLESMSNQKIKTNCIPDDGYFFSDKYLPERQIDKTSIDRKCVPQYDLIRNMWWLDYYECIEKWSQGFGKENIIVKPYERNQMVNDIVYDFYSSLLGFQDDEIKAFKKDDSGTHNRRLGRDILEYKLQCMKMNLKLERQWKYDLLSDSMGNVDAYQCYYSLEERKKILDLFSESNEKLAREYLCRDDGILFYEGLPEHDDDYPGLSVEKAIRISHELASLHNKAISEKLSLLTSDIESLMLNVDIELPYVRYLERLIMYALLHKSRILIYGVHGKMAYIALQRFAHYPGLDIVGVTDKSAKHSFIIGEMWYMVYKYEDLERVAPDIIVITAQFSGKDIYEGLKKLNLSKTEIFPLYDLKDEIWNSVL